MLVLKIDFAASLIKDSEIFLSPLLGTFRSSNIIRLCNSECPKHKSPVPNQHHKMGGDNQRFRETKVYRILQLCIFRASSLGPV